jgi:hypothetical protein
MKRYRHINETEQRFKEKQQLLSKIKRQSKSVYNSLPYDITYYELIRINNFLENKAHYGVKAWVFILIILGCVLMLVGGALLIGP